MDTRNKILSVIAVAVVAVCLALPADSHANQALASKVLRRAEVCTAQAICYLGIPSEWAVRVLLFDAVSRRVNPSSAMELKVIGTDGNGPIVVETSENRRAK